MYQGSDIPIREYLKKGYLRFLYELGELDEVEEAWINTIGEEFLMEVEKTSMSKSYKIPVLLSFVKDGVMVTDVSIEEVGKSFMDYYKNSKVHRKDFTDKNACKLGGMGSLPLYKRSFTESNKVLIKKQVF